MAGNFKYGLYDKSAVTPGYFGTPKTSSSDDRLRELGILEDEPVQATGLSASIKEANEPSFIEKATDTFTGIRKAVIEDPAKDIFEGGKTLVDDIKLLKEGRVDEMQGLLGDAFQGGEQMQKNIKELNSAIDETGGSMFDKTIGFGLNVVGAGVDFGGDLIVSSLKTLAPEGLERATEEGLQNFLQTDFGKGTVDFIKTGGEKYEAFKKTSPEANRLGLTIESLLPLAEIATGGATGKVVKEVGGEIIETGVKKSGELLTSGKEIVGESVESIKEGVSNLTLPDLPKLGNNPSKIAENIAGIDDQTKNILKESTTEDFNKYVQAGKDAAENIKNPSPMDIAGQEVGDVLLDITNRKKESGKRMGEIVKSNPDVRINTGELLTNYQTFLKDRFNLEVDGNTLKVSPIKGKESKTSDINLIETLNNDILSIVTKENIGIEDLEAISSRIKSNFSKLLSDRGVGSSLSADEKSLKGFIGGEITGMIKKNLPEEYSTASADFARLIDMEDRLNKLLGDSGDKGASFIKSAYSPQTGTRFRRLSEDILEETGIDITTKAGLAKFSMQLAGDPRQASLLEALDLGTGFTGKLTSKLKNVPIVGDLAELVEIGAKKLFPTENVGRGLTK